MPDDKTSLDQIVGRVVARMPVSQGSQVRDWYYESALSINGRTRSVLVETSRDPCIAIYLCFSLSRSINDQRQFIVPLQDRVQGEYVPSPLITRPDYRYLVRVYHDGATFVRMWGEDGLYAWLTKQQEAGTLRTQDNGTYCYCGMKSVHTTHRLFFHSPTVPSAPPAPARGKGRRISSTAFLRCQPDTAPASGGSAVEGAVWEAARSIQGYPLSRGALVNRLCAELTQFTRTQVSSAVSRLCAKNGFCVVGHP